MMWLCHDTLAFQDLVRIGSPSRYQGVGEAGGTQVDIQSEEKASSDCTTIQIDPEIAGSRDPLRYMVQSMTDLHDINRHVSCTIHWLCQADIPCSQQS